MLDEGDRVPADLRLPVTRELQVDESALTGESRPAGKGPAALPVDTEPADRTTTAHAGSLVSTGRRGEPRTWSSPMAGDFTSVTAAVEEGRSVLDNPRKSVARTLPATLAEGLVILAATLVGVVLPILPAQLLRIDMTTAVALGPTLAFEPREPGIATRRWEVSSRPSTGASPR